jgi:hypothetical protein
VGQHLKRAKMHFGGEIRAKLVEMTEVFSHAG